MFIVISQFEDAPADNKVFTSRDDARAYMSCRIDEGAIRSDIFETTPTDARAAIAAFKAGEARFKEGKSSQISDEEYERRRNAEWELARKEGRIGLDAFLRWMGV